jgi:hypothetical protein
MKKANTKNPRNTKKGKVTRLPEALDAAASDAERDAIVAEEVAAAAADVPTDPEEAALHREAMSRLAESRAARGRPKIGRGAAKFNVTMERSLLERVDAYAKRNHMTRAAVLACGVERLMAG